MEKTTTAVAVTPEASLGAQPPIIKQEYPSSVLGCEGSGLWVGGWVGGLVGWWVGGWVGEVGSHAQSTIPEPNVFVFAYCGYWLQLRLTLQLQ